MAQSNEPMDRSLLDDQVMMVRPGFRMLSGLLAVLFLSLAIFPPADSSLLGRAVAALGGVVWGALALIPIRRFGRLGTPPVPRQRVDLWLPETHGRRQIVSRGVPSAGKDVG